jgi:chaperone BCS1
MALPLSSVSLRALAKTGAAASTSISEVLHAPHFGFLRAFFSTWLKLDLTTLAATLTIFSTLSGALKVVKGLALKVYWWFTKFCTASISIASSDRLNREIVNWLGAKVLERQATRVLTARTETIQNDAWHRPTMAVERNDYLQ